ncbi:MAG: glycoside hydrolase family 30 protein [Paludibacter sp.]|nr:glycoside hydrolase family 30 protein [Paludibacter sp.]
MKKKTTNLVIVVSVWLLSFGFIFGQTKVGFSTTSTPNSKWQISTVEIKQNIIGSPDIEIKLDDPQQTFYGWGTCFNELGWDALNLLKSVEQDEIYRKFFSPTGDLRLSIGRIPVGANDYARSWYSSDEVDGDFDMNYFNVDRDKRTLIPYIKKALSYNPNMTFWASPWSPPTWLKTNKHYANKSGGGNGLATSAQCPLYTNQFIQSSKYMQSYALYFSKFIDAYKAEGINITTLMYQNEAYSYAIYPACSWTDTAVVTFNSKYLGPYFKVHQPNVELFLGTMNTSNMVVYDDILSNIEIGKYIKGVGFQWEGANALPAVRRKYPNYKSVQSESECGSGTFNWSAAVHTNDLIQKYISNGCEKYTFWNAILKDAGLSTWGWAQNSFVRVNSSDLTYVYTPEYYAIMHNSHFVQSGAVRLNISAGTKKLLAFRTPQNSIVIIMANTETQDKTYSVKAGDNYFQMRLPANSFNTYVLADPLVGVQLLATEANTLKNTALITNSVSDAQKLSETSADKDIVGVANELSNAIYDAQKLVNSIALLNSLIAKANSLTLTNNIGKDIFVVKISNAEQIVSSQNLTNSIVDSTIVDLQNAMNTFLWAQSISTTNVADMTSFIQTPSFHTGTVHNSSNGSILGWNFLNVASSGDFRLNYVGGKNCWNSWSNSFTSMNMYQDLIGLVPGLYSVSCSLMCNSGEINNQHAYLESSLQSDVSPVMTIDNGWNTVAGWDKVTTKDVLVGLDGKLRIGAASTSGGTTKGWFCATDFVLSYKGNSDTLYNGLLKSKIASAMQYKSLRMLKSDSIFLNQGIYFASKVIGRDSIDKAISWLNAAINRATLSNTALTKYYNVTKIAAANFATQQLQNLSSINLINSLISNQQQVLEKDTVTLITLNALDAILSSALNYVSADQTARTYINSALYDATALTAFQSFLTEQNKELLLSVNSTEVNALTKELTEAMYQLRLTQQPGDTTDFTFMIKNADSGTATGLDLSEGWSGIIFNCNRYTNSGLHYSGNTANMYFDAYNGTVGALRMTVDQYISGLPNGTYKFRCAGRADGNGAMIYAKTSQSTYKTDIINSGYSGGAIWANAVVGSAEKNVNSGNGYGWNWSEIKDISVTDNQLTIGFSNENFTTSKAWTGTWYSVDDFKLYYIKSAPSALINLQTDSHPIVYCSDKKIHVLTSEKWTLFTISGIQLNTKSTLQDGIYIVKIGAYTAKVIVK